MGGVCNLRAEGVSVKEEERRAFWFLNNQWKHVYIIENFNQVDIFGQDISISRVKLKKNTNEIHEVETEKLKSSRPSRRKNLA